MLNMTVKETLDSSPCGHMIRVLVARPTMSLKVGDVVRLDGKTFRVIELVTIIDKDRESCLGLTVVEA